MTESCTHTSPLENSQLLAYLEGQADSQTRLHIQTCAACRQKVTEMGNINAYLSRVSHCPTHAQLGEYNLGLLSEMESRWIANHLKQCSTCQQDLGELRAFLEEPDTSRLQDAQRKIGEWRQGLQTLVATLLSPGRLGLAASGLRALKQSDPRPLVFEAGDVVTILQVEEDVERPGRLRLRGEVVCEAALDDLEVVIWDEDHRSPISRSEVSPVGFWLLENLLPGKYDLFLKNMHRTILIQNIQLTAF